MRSSRRAGVGCSGRKPRSRDKASDDGGRARGKIVNAAALAAIILTKNEEADLPACLSSLSGVAAEVYVIDSGSTDRTCEIAGQYGARR